MNSLFSVDISLLKALFVNFVCVDFSFTLPSFSVLVEVAVV